jgi:long-chain acyl-CoA synthetase
LLTHIRDLSAVWDLTGESINLVAMPAFHIGGTYDFLISYVVGARAILLREIDPLEIIRLVPERRVTHLFLVPAALQLLLDTPGAEHSDLSSVRTLSLRRLADLRDPAGTRSHGDAGVGFFQVYGLTESGNVGYLHADHHDPTGRPELLRSCGQVEPWFETRVADAHGAEVRDGEVGELWLRSVQTMKGYWNNPEGTAAAITADGWPKTGDAVSIDAEGFMFLRDRIKDMIISGGENVYPAEVENAVMKHPDVADCAVLGVPDERWGEVPVAVVVRRPDTTPTTGSIIAHCGELLAPFKCPKSVEFVDELPRNASGKLLRRELRARWNN